MTRNVFPHYSQTAFFFQYFFDLSDKTPSPTILLQADLALITEVAARVDEAVATFEVEHTEELVVPFGDN